MMADESEGESPTSLDLGRIKRQDLCILQLLEINNLGLFEIVVVGFTKFAGAEKCRALEAADVVEGVEARIHVVEAMLGLILGTHMAGLNPRNF